MKFKCSLDNEIPQSCGEGLTGEWKRTNVPHGRHNFRVIATDSFGKTLEIEVRGWTVDAEPPSIVFTNAPSKTNKSPLITWKSTEFAKFQCSLDNREFEDCGEGISGRWTKTISGGQHKLTVRGKDNVGNLGNEITHTWFVGKFLLSVFLSIRFLIYFYNFPNVKNKITVVTFLAILDTVPPVITFINPPTKTNNSPELKWSASEEAKFECALDRGPYEDCGKGINGQWRNDNVPSGSHVLSVRGKDSFENEGSLTTHTWTVGKLSSAIVI